MAINLIEAWDVDNVLVKVKFEPSVKVATITNARFTLLTDVATPVVVSADPFETIDLVEDYNSIGKILELRWKANILSPNVNYILRFSGFRTADNQIILDDNIEFTSTSSATPDYVMPPEDEWETIDYTDSSLWVVTDSSTEASSSSTTVFALIESDPLDFDVFLPEDYNNGVVTLKFNIKPNYELLTSAYFLAQRKPIQRKPARWENVATIITADPIQPWVYIKFPSNDATPIYDSATPIYSTTGPIYFEENYKYRIRISKDLGT